MNRTVVGMITTTFVVFVYGFLFWQVNSLPYEALEQTPDDVTAQAMLKEHFPRSGSYYIPGRQHRRLTSTSSLNRAQWALFI